MGSDDNSPQPVSDFVPGTVLLVDFDGTLDTRHAQGHRDIVLVPTPSEDPDDPLNWSRWRKTLLMATLCVYVQPPTVEKQELSPYEQVLPCHWYCFGRHLLRSCSDLSCHWPQCR